MKRRAAVATAGLVFAGLTLASCAQTAFASDADPTPTATATSTEAPTPYTTALFLVTTVDGKVDLRLDQPFLDAVPGSDLSVFDARMECGATYQVDIYRPSNGDDPSVLWKDLSLHYATDGRFLAYDLPFTPYKVVTTPDCETEPTWPSTPSPTASPTSPTTTATPVATDAPSPDPTPVETSTPTTPIPSSPVETASPTAAPPAAQPPATGAPATASPSSTSTASATAGPVVASAGSSEPVPTQADAVLASTGTDRGVLAWTLAGAGVLLALGIALTRASFIRARRVTDPDTIDRVRKGDQ